MAEKSLPKINKIDRPFWEGAAAGRLLLQKCRGCAQLQFFPRAVCVNCFSSELEWTEASGGGKIHSFTWVRAPRNPAFKDEVPICFANVMLDEGVIMETRIVGAGVEKVQTAKTVKVAFKETADPNIKLPVFELAE